MADQSTSSEPGRSCPVHYRYQPKAIAQVDATDATVLYVIGGLYGNSEALKSILTLIDYESAPVTLCFNGDFNWFNVEPTEFQQVNQSVLQFDALRGNVETELANVLTTGDCGCAYPHWVESETVERSNLIINNLKATASGFPEITDRLDELPMYARYQLGEMTVAVVHGDCESLSGWGLAQEIMDQPNQQQLIHQWADQAASQVIASTHTCLPFLYGTDAVQIINNGAAGMPNFGGTQYGCISRLATVPRPEGIASLYGQYTGHIYLDAVPVNYDHSRWIDKFQLQWPEGSAAHRSYFDRLQGKLFYTLAQAQRFM